MINTQRQIQYIMLAGRTIIIFTILLVNTLCFDFSDATPKPTNQPLEQLGPSVTNCTLPQIISCPPENYCENVSLIIMKPGTTFNCEIPWNISAQAVVVEGGILTGVINIYADLVEVNGVTIFGNLSIFYNMSVLFRQTIYIENTTTIIPTQISSLELPSQTNITFVQTSLRTKKLLMQALNIRIFNSNITTFPNICLYEVMNLFNFNRISPIGLLPVLTQLLASPINIVMYGQDLFVMEGSLIVTTIISIYSNFSNITFSYVNTTASGCPTNLGLGKGLQAQMPNHIYCSSGGSSAGYGTFSNNSACSSVLQYFMFLSHSFPYLNKGPFLSTGSGGYGYREGLGNQGAGGGIIFLFSDTEFYAYKSQFLANGGNVSGNYYVSAGSGGTLFLYTKKLSGNYSNFSAAGGASLNNNGSGSGGIVKISYLARNFSQGDSMWVDVSAGYQPHASNSSTVENNGIFYGTFCQPGQYPWYLTCHPCEYGTYSLLGDTSCQQCPVANDYPPNIDQNLLGISQITQCFSQKHESVLEKLISPDQIKWILIIIYIGALLVTLILGLLIKKYYKKKLSVMQTQSFSLEDAKKDVEQSRILTERLKMQRNIKFEDLMYHIHRITLFGSNNPQCPWALPEFPPEQIKKYILRQGFIDFSVKFNKIAKWTKFQKLMCNISFLLYPWHWYYYDKIKKQKYKKLLQLLEESKQFNLINNYDFEDKNMVTIKISKNTDYTICYLDFMVYDRADTKYFNLNSPFIISISGEGNFLRPFYLEDRDVFFNSLFYIINKAKEKIEEQQQQQIDAKRQLFTNLFSQKKKQQNRNKLIDFLKKFNTISITLDLSAPLSTFISTLISLIQYLAHWNQSYFKELNIQLDLILMISKIKKGHLVSNQIHILTNKNPELFKEFMQTNIPKMNRYQKYDLKLGLFVYNPDQEMKKFKNRKSTRSPQKKNWTVVSQVIGEEDSEAIQEPLVEPQPEFEQQQEKKKNFKIVQSLVRFCNFMRYLGMTHRKLEFDKDLTKFFATVVILFQCMLTSIWSIKLQFPYVLANLLSSFIGILWMVSGSYGIGKLYLIFNSMALLDEIVMLIIILCLPEQSQTERIRTMVCEIVTIAFRIMIIPLATKFLSVSRKLSTSKMFK